MSLILYGSIKFFYFPSHERQLVDSYITDNEELKAITEHFNGTASIFSKSVYNLLSFVLFVVVMFWMAISLTIIPHWASFFFNLSKFYQYKSHSLQRCNFSRLGYLSNQRPKIFQH